MPFPPPARRAAPPPPPPGLSGPRPGPRVAVVGAGVGGLTTAALLAHAGLPVTVFERNERIGGKLNWLEADGYSWDTGPSLLTMPYVFRRLWERLGRRLEDDLTLVPLPVTCRYHWTDGTVIDEDAAFWRRPAVARFLRYARGLYDLSAEAFLHHPLEEWWRQLRPANLAHLRHLPKIATFRTMDEVVRRHFPGDPHLVQLFNRFATYNGSSPYQTPAAFNVIPYVEAAFGGWYVRGGLYQLARALGRRAEEAGAKLRLGTTVTAVEPDPRGGYRLRLADDPPEHFGRVVCNQDVLSAYPGLLAAAGSGPSSGVDGDGGSGERAAEASVGEAHRGRGRRQRAGQARFVADRSRRDLATSGFVLYLGMAGHEPRLSHHNILFSDDYPAEFRQLHEEGRPADEPTVYVAIHSRADPDRAPPDGENWFVLVNAPALAEGADATATWSEARTQAYGDRVLARLETGFGLTGLRRRVRVRHAFTPADFAARYQAFGGSLYGFASHGVSAAFRRPRLRLPDWPDLHFVGGSTHPGGGLPLVCLSGQMVADQVLRSSAGRRPA